MTGEQKLKPCPICGRKAIVNHDVIHNGEYSFGWSVGCPSAKIGDGIHGFYDYESFKAAKLVLFGFPTKKAAIEAWNRRRDREVPND